MTGQGMEVPKEAAIHFFLGTPVNNWVMRLTMTGVEFNTKDFPEYVAEDFARDVVASMNEMITTLVKERVTELTGVGLDALENVNKILGDVKKEN